MSGVLLAEFAPAMLWGARLGALVDRHGPRACAIVADALAALAFTGLLVAGSPIVFVALCALAGTGAALAARRTWRSCRASRPRTCRRQRSPTA